MKKLIALLFVGVLILTACSTKETGKSQEELKAEIRKELEEEAKKKAEEEKAKKDKEAKESKKTKEDNQLNQKKEEDNKENSSNNEKISNNSNKNSVPETIAGKKVLEYSLTDSKINIKLDGEFTGLVGTVSYDKDYYEAFILDVRNLPGMVPYSFTLQSEEITIIPPTGTYILDENYLHGVIGDDVMESIKSGKSIDVDCNISNYTYSAKYESGYGTNGDVKITDFEISKRDDVFYPKDLVKGTKVSDKFTVDYFDGQNIEEISYKLQSNEFIKGELYTEHDMIYVRFAENLFDKNVLLKDELSSDVESEIDFNAYAFYVDKSKLKLPPEYISYIMDGGIIQGAELYVNEISYEIDPMAEKTNAIISEVKINDDEVKKINEAINKKATNTKPDIYLTGFENETLYYEDSEFDMNYSKYSLVIIPMQESKNMAKLTPRVVKVTETGKEGMLSFSVFGTLHNVKLSYVKNANDSSEKPKEIFIADKIENECVLISSEMPTDFSYITITGNYQYVSSMEEISFALDDMRDPESYRIFTVDAYSFPNEDY